MARYLPARAGGAGSLGSGLCLPLCLLFAPGCHPAEPTANLPAGVSVSRKPLPESDPVGFLEKCLQRYDQQAIRGYRLTMQKQERIDGQLHSLEVIDVAFRAHPYSVFMRWREGASQADRALYVAGQNDGKMLVHPTGLIGRLVSVAAIDPEGSRAREAGRYSIKDFGLKKTLERTLKDWKSAREKGTLRVKYLGVRKLGPAGDRPCYTLRRTYPKPDVEGITEVTVYIDRQTWFQVGTVLLGQDKTLIGEYVYRDIHLNPKFQPDQFERAALTD